MDSDLQDSTQDLISQNVGLKLAVQRLLQAVESAYRETARPMIEDVRDRVVRDLKESGIDAEYELDHARLVGPAIDAVVGEFGDFLERLDARD